MAAYNKFDPRLESLVVEARTNWAENLRSLSSEERRSISQRLHRAPHLATQIFYERTHTGFIREITVTSTDLDQSGHSAENL